MVKQDNQFDVIVIGGGHAGTEAANAAAKLGVHVGLMTMSKDSIAAMSCNPAIGGQGKGQIVREIDAMGGLMGLAIDKAGIQFKVLNRRKGPAVWGPRAQADKWLYKAVVQEMISAIDNITIIEDTAKEINAPNNIITGVLGNSGTDYCAPIVILTTGTFMKGLMHVGTEQREGGRINEPAAVSISDSLVKLGIPLERLKTGTPPRLSAKSLNFDALETQAGDEEPLPFSYLNKTIGDQKQIKCWITYTNAKTHEIIKRKIDESPMYSGQIDSTGPRYCPSIETKVVRFSDKSRHMIFLEPEGLDTDSIYVNGISTSLSKEIQEEMVHSIAGLENAVFLKHGYAIEYDYIPPVNTRSSLESKHISGLYFAGQINGTSGYEEAGGQGLIAGINGARKKLGKEPIILTRAQAYIGVMIDDLVTKAHREPYRMFTSRAEHRLMLRGDNADERLTPLAKTFGLIDDVRWQTYLAKQTEIDEITALFKTHKEDGKSIEQLLKQAANDADWLLALDTKDRYINYAKITLQTVINNVRYSGYIVKQQRMIDRFQKTEKLRLPYDFDYHSISQLRHEAKETLSLYQPASLGQASRLAGINPADVTVLMIYMESRHKK
jgi:tRNA uridine 5-carboxymethylaminomethyl modification enzyme